MASIEQENPNFIEDISKFFSDVSEINANYFTSVKHFVTSTEVTDLTKGFSDNNKESFDAGFNLFLIISQLYHRENLHSDVLYAILNPGQPKNDQEYSTHREGDKFLVQFLKLIQKFPGGQDILISDYSEAVVTREEHRIDILIKSDKKAIIIENKVNGAIDQDEQISRYHRKLTDDENLEVDAIVYLTLDGQKSPELQSIGSVPREKIIELPMYHHLGKDLYTLFIKECIMLSSDFDALFILKQYSKLIKYLAGETMNYPIMSKFYDLLKDEKKFEVADDIVKMMNEMPGLRAQQIEKEFKSKYYPLFPGVNLSKDAVTFKGYRFREHSYELHIELHRYETSLRFWDTNYGDGNSENTQMLHNLMKEINSATSSHKFEFGGNDEYVSNFKFPAEEEGLYLFLHEFREVLVAISE